MDKDKALITMINNMPEKTGKSLEEWLKILSRNEFGKHSEAVNFLKKEHGVTHGFANTIVHISKSEKTEDVDLVDLQYRGKESLMPIYKSIINIVNEFGDDIEIAPKKSYVSLRAKKQFAIIQASTKSRIDLGLNLKGYDAQGILEAAGSFNAMCSHRIRIEKDSEINQEIKKWLEESYKLSR